MQSCFTQSKTYRGICYYKYVMTAAVFNECKEGKDKFMKDSSTSDNESEELNVTSIFKAVYQYILIALQCQHYVMFNIQDLGEKNSDSTSI